MLVRPFTTLLGIDPEILRRCPLQERVTAHLVALVALSNCVALSASIAHSLTRLGEAEAIAATIGVASGVWFAVIQRLLVILHGYRRGSWRGIISRAFCMVFLVLFGGVAAYGVWEAYAPLPAQIWYPAVIDAFIFPFLMAPKMLGEGEYAQELRVCETAVLDAWRYRFVEQYEGFVREHYALPNYRIPHGMLQYGGNSGSVAAPPISRVD